jgi:hypothetical protein
LFFNLNQNQKLQKKKKKKKQEQLKSSTQKNLNKKTCLHLHTQKLYHWFNLLAHACLLPWITERYENLRIRTCAKEKKTSFVSAQNLSWILFISQDGSFKTRKYRKYLSEKQ